MTFENLPNITGAGLYDSREEFLHGTRSVLRKVEQYELELFVEEGGCTHLNGAAYPVEKGNLLVAKPGDERFSDLHFKCLYLHVECAIPGVCELMESLAGLIKVEEYGLFEDYFRRIEKTFLSADAFDKWETFGTLLSLLSALRNERRQLPETEFGKESIVRRAREFVSAHYAEEIGVAEIAAACHVSVSYLHRLFSERMGCSPHKVLADKRIFMAKKLLVGGTQSIGQIAAACGFRTQAYFSDCFKRTEGLTPKEFRERALYLP